MNTVGVLSKLDFENKRKKKDLNRRQIKEQRKNRVKESKLASKPSAMDKEQFIKKKDEQKQTEDDK